MCTVRLVGGLTLLSLLPIEATLVEGSCSFRERLPRHQRWAGSAS